MDSLASSWLNEHPTFLYASSQSITKALGIDSTTSGLFKYIPGLVDYYGPDKPVDISLDLESVSNF
jgi:hypothetical protein